MPKTTPNLALPYPEPTDPISQGATTIQALAEKIEALQLATPRIWKIIWDGHGTSGVSTDRYQSFDFPGPAFLTVPKVEFLSITKLSSYSGHPLEYSANDTKIIHYDYGSGSYSSYTDFEIIDVTKTGFRLKSDYSSYPYLILFSARENPENA